MWGAVQRLYSQSRERFLLNSRGTQLELHTFVSLPSPRKQQTPAPVTGGGLGMWTPGLSDTEALVAQRQLFEESNRCQLLESGCTDMRPGCTGRIKSFWELWPEHQALAVMCLFCDASLDALGCQSPIHSFWPDLSHPQLSLQRCLKQDF